MRQTLLRYHNYFLVKCYKTKFGQILFSVVFFLLEEGISFFFSEGDVIFVFNFASSPSAVVSFFLECWEWDSQTRISCNGFSPGVQKSYHYNLWRYYSLKYIWCHSYLIHEIENLPLNLSNVTWVFVNKVTLNNLLIIYIELD